MALAKADETAEDLETLDLTTCKERITQLQADRERMQERTERLQEKLKALNNELASRKLEANRKDQELKEEQRRNRQLADERREAGEDGSRPQSSKDADATRVRQCIEEILGDKCGRNLKRVNDFGFRDFDEQDLMVEKPIDDSNKDPPVDTVLVTWHKPNSDDVRCNLTYRVDNKTPSKKLRKDACDYWDLSEVEYVLLTAENSKVHDDMILQHCFKGTERLQLILSQKNPRAQQNVLLEVEKDASAAVMGKYVPKGKKVTAENQGEDQSKKGYQQQTFREWLKDKPGLWEFMTQRDMNVIHHLKHIKLRNIILYFLTLCATTAVLGFVLPVSQAYYLRNGSSSALTKLRVDELQLNSQAKPFEDIRTRSEAWDWMKIVLSSQLLDFSSDFREHNYVPGWLRIRMQQVDNATHENCEPEDTAPDQSVCYEKDYNSETAGKTNIVYVQSYWEGWIPPSPTTTTTTTVTTSSTTTSTTTSSTTATRTYTTSTTTTTTTFFRPVASTAWNWNLVWPGVMGLDGRSNTTNPYTFKDSKDNADDFFISPMLGKFGDYDASGYNLDYDMQFENMSDLRQAFRQDMDFLKEWDWISEKTRAVHIQFVLYNGDYDMWTENKFLLEMPVNSIVTPIHRVNFFRPTTMDTGFWEKVAILDVYRAVFVLYLITFHFYSEAMWQRANDRSCARYFITFGGIADQGIAVGLIFIFIVRYVSLGISGDAIEFLEEVAGNDFVGVTNKVFLYRMQIFVEAPVLILTVFRFLTFMRVNRQLFVIFETINESMHTLSRFFLVLLPVFLGLSVLAHAIWASYADYFSSLHDSVMSIVMMANGDVPVRELFSASRPVTMLFGCGLYIVLWFFLINIWAGVVISTYQTVRVKAGFQPREYAWREYQYVQWCLCWLCWPCYFNVLRPKIEKPKSMVSDDDSDDEKKP
mmetsp:Transcript_153544/g.283038  ORF Transcript_153544/g.283038 Transcript_153544/m.283038 type:complete len:927 (+) Transcript_153544:108-2888(+)